MGVLVPPYGSAFHSQDMETRKDVKGINMRNIALTLTAGVLLLMLLCGASAMAEGVEDDLDEWTVMLYVCGSDLESKYAYATGNLEELAGVGVPINYFDMMNNGIESMTGENDGRFGEVNIVLQTGGCSQWHTYDLRMDIDPGVLQRWHYAMYPYGGMGGDKGDGFELEETLPLASMADPGTLSDYVRWAAENYPAKKYALVLWDHGDGARSGLFIDELFDKDTMYLYELKQALADGGIHFDAVIIDACLMANLETAWNLKDSADWMVASEEVVPGKGTAIGEWMQELICYPECDGEWLGRCVCDTTSIKYANEESEEARSVLTWSVVNLSRVDAVVKSFESFFQTVGDTLRDNSESSNLFTRMIFEASEYGDGQQNMRDLGSLVYNRNLMNITDMTMRNAAVKALSDAVDYCVRGAGRAEARGLTFCYPMEFDDEELDVYAKNFPIPVYLAYIDAVSPWTAPDWVYDSVERLPEIDDIEELKIQIKRKISETGMPGVMFHSPEPNLDNVYYTLYQKDEETGEVLKLGRTNCGFESTEDFTGQIWRANDPMHWPAIDGQLICMDFLKEVFTKKLYNVPVQLDSKTCLLRCGRDINYDDEGNAKQEYEIYGLWEGYDENSTLLNRSVEPLSKLSGREYRLLYPIDGTEKSGKTDYQAGEPLTMYRALNVEEIPVPAGTYYLEYEVDDLFMRRTVLERIEIQWDGQNMTFPGAERWDDGDWVDLKELGQP